MRILNNNSGLQHIAVLLSIGALVPALAVSSRTKNDNDAPVTWHKQKFNGAPGTGGTLQDIDIFLSDDHPATMTTEDDQKKQQKNLAGSVGHKNVTKPPLVHGFAVSQDGATLRMTPAGIHEPLTTGNWTLQSVYGGGNYYLYGVHANRVNPEEVFVNGFYDSTNGAYGIYQWSEDGGKTWPETPTNSSNGEWLQGPINFAGRHGMFVSQGGSVFTSSNYGHSWFLAPSNLDGWSAGNFLFESSGRAMTAGISVCNSHFFGKTWDCKPALNGLTLSGIDCGQLPTAGGGSVTTTSGTQEVCLTAGGAIEPKEGFGTIRLNGTWSMMASGLTNFELKVAFVLEQAQRLVLIGGSFFDGGGVVYSSGDLGHTWRLDLNSTENGFPSCRKLALPHADRIYCVGDIGNNIWSADYPAVTQRRQEKN